MKLLSILLFLVTHSIPLIIFLTPTDCLECFICQSVDDPVMCNTSVVCGQNEFCYLDGFSGHYSMGCSSSQNCGASTAGSLVGRNIKETVIKSFREGNNIANKREIRQTTNCHECCSTDGCNTGLCSHLKPTMCVDDETMDCAKLSTLFNICQDIQKAKSVCPRFCNLCNIVDGEWSSWTAWSVCDVTCDVGVQTKTRTCTNPSPAHGGLDCVGDKAETKQCKMDACPVHGGWSNWSGWGSCSATCDIGLQRRDRTCSNPWPSRFGEHCFGDAHEDRICHSNPCADGGWSDWSTWGQCSESCGGGLRSKTRTCSNPKPSILGTPCLGAMDRVSLCNKQTCPDHRIAFTAYGIAKISQGNQAVRFPLVLENHGGGYNATTGVFTSLTPGIYSFSATLTQPYTAHYSYFSCILYRNHLPMITLYTYKSTGIDESFQASGTGSFHLNKNDSVNIASCPTSIIQNDRSTFFSGILVTPDI